MGSRPAGGPAPADGLQGTGDNTNAVGGDSGQQAQQEAGRLETAASEGSTPEPEAKKQRVNELDPGLDDDAHMQEV